MATTQTINNLIINNIESQEVYDYMLANGLINDNELYLVHSGENPVVLYTAQELTEEQKAQVRTNINAASNDLANTAKKGLMSASDKSKLNNITSGATKNIITLKTLTMDDFVSDGTITFTISGNLSNNTFTADSGMTWGAWVDSDYNTEGFWVSGSNIQIFCGFTANVYNVNQNAVLTSDVIMSGGSYYVGG